MYLTLGDCISIEKGLSYESFNRKHPNSVYYRLAQSTKFINISTSKLEILLKLY